ncbi:alanine racemase [Pigmentiphaga aceris]|uniref:Alanine racemase n=1 Tax=Pigmentiphaga aceris TaxID=1940612 RepID=A0A5C0AXC7_9BURK|nr:alanine racemase [Pigmentiphaga aceris]QEI06063.1 alanine racemase [Pigmentiphaga aceris]
MPRPISASISRAAFAHNLATVRRHLAAAAATAGNAPPRIWSVIKANAYGHGIERAVAGFSESDGLAMLDLNEAVRCREAGWVGPILLLEGFFQPADLDLVSRYHLTVSIHCDEQLRMLEAARFSRPVDVFVKLNSGMNRLGFKGGYFLAAHRRLSALQQSGVVGSVGSMTHFATADGPEGIADQATRFRAAVSGLEGPLSLCNSAATLRFPEYAADWVRPGVALYGASPFNDQTAEQFGLRPVMTLRSELIGTQTLDAGEAVGYGHRYRAERGTRIGVVACGYADGYPRHAPTGTPIVVGGVRTQTIGRVSMDMLAVDLSNVPDAVVGTPVVLWGEGGPSVDEVAQAADTIGYELLCALAPRVPVHGVD